MDMEFLSVAGHMGRHRSPPSVRCPKESGGWCVQGVERRQWDHSADREEGLWKWDGEVRGV